MCKDSYVEPLPTLKLILDSHNYSFWLVVMALPEGVEPSCAGLEDLARFRRRELGVVFGGWQRTRTPRQLKALAWLATSTNS